MQKIEIVIGAKLLKHIEAAAKRRNVDRSSLIRTAVLEHLKRLREAELEEQERRAYIAKPLRPEEYEPWERIAAWPEG